MAMSNERYKTSPKDIKIILDNLNSENSKTVRRALGLISRIGATNPGKAKKFLPSLSRFLNDRDDEMCYRCCWAIGQIGFRKPEWVEKFLPRLSKLTKHKHIKVREHAVWALGRIGRAKPEIIVDYIPVILKKLKDKESRVRSGAIWACENIATTCPELFKRRIKGFLKLLDDDNIEHVRREAPEIFRVIGKKRPDMVKCAIPKLKEMLNDKDKVARAHAAGALKVIEKNLDLLK